MAEDNTLTPIEVFVAAHALDLMLDKFGDDAVIQSARDKLDRVLQAAQAIDPTLLDRIKSQRQLLLVGKRIQRDDRIDERRNRLRGLGLPDGREPMPPVIREDDEDVGYRFGS